MTIFFRKRTRVIQIDDNKLSDINSDYVPTVARITYCQDVTRSITTTEQNP